MKKLMLALVAAGLALPALAANTTVYTNDFSSGAGSAWSNTSTSDAPNGQSFLGQFGNTNTTLTLDGLAAHNSVTISFDLYVIRSWDGNSYSYGPDIWGINIGNGPVTLSNFTTTFSNWSNSPQSFPNAIFSGSHPAQTGAVAVNTLGYGTTDGWGDATYHFSFTVNHSDAKFQTTFWGAGQQGTDDEGWGIDNVKVSVTAVPEPETYALFLAGLGVMGAVARRRKAKAA